MSTSELIPLSDRVMIELIEEETITTGGIFLPTNNNSRDLTTKAKVLSVGAGALLANGTRVPPEVAVGDTVLIDRTSGLDIKVNNRPVRIIGERNIIAILRTIED